MPLNGDTQPTDEPDTPPVIIEDGSIGGSGNVVF